MNDDKKNAQEPNGERLRSRQTERTDDELLSSILITNKTDMSKITSSSKIYVNTKQSN